MYGPETQQCPAGRLSRIPSRRLPPCQRPPLGLVLRDAFAIVEGVHRPLHLLADEEMILDVLEHAIVREPADHLDDHFLDRDALLGIWHYFPPEGSFTGLRY